MRTDDRGNRFLIEKESRRLLELARRKWPRLKSATAIGRHVFGPAVEDGGRIFRGVLSGKRGWPIGPYRERIAAGFGCKTAVDQFWEFISGTSEKVPTCVDERPVDEISTTTPRLDQRSRRRGRHEPVFTGDRSRFVKDLSVPDGSIVRVNERFVKKWEIANVGTIPWVDRYLVRQGPAQARGRLRSDERTPIPRTLPGENCVIAVELVAPDMPGSCYAEWKMTDTAGRILLPNQKPVYVSVDVTQ